MNKVTIIIFMLAISFYISAKPYLQVYQIDEESFDNRFGLLEKVKEDAIKSLWYPDDVILQLWRKENPFFEKSIKLQFFELTFFDGVSSTIFVLYQGPEGTFGRNHFMIQIDFDVSGKMSSYTIKNLDEYDAPPAIQGFLNQDTLENLPSTECEF